MRTAFRQSGVRPARRAGRLASVRSAARAVLLAALLGPSPRLAQAAGPGPEEAPGPRTLILALDAVPFRVAAEACRRGAFADWSPLAALVAPFPSMTHVGFASLFLPFGVAPSKGYEIHHFDTTANDVVGACFRECPRK